MGRSMYDEVAGVYARSRRPDPRIASRIEAALGGARTVLNVGAGTGSYEPPGREVTAVEPSAEMIARRPPDAAPAVRAGAERLPFRSDSFDAAMAVLTVHHWRDREAGLREMLRVARARVLVVAFDPGPVSDFWMVREYFPEIAALHSSRLPTSALVAELPGARVEAVPVPRDCTDLFFAALWARPELLLEPDVVEPMWVWQSLSPAARERGLARLAADLESGAWDDRHGGLRELPELDVGLRLVGADAAGRPGGLG